MDVLPPVKIQEAAGRKIPPPPHTHSFYLEVGRYQRSEAEGGEHFIAEGRERHIHLCLCCRCWMTDSINLFIIRKDLAVPVCVCVCWRVSLLYDDWWAPEDQPVIVLADLADSHKGFQVLIRLVGVDVVEGAAVPRIPVRSREVYGHLRQACA